MPNRAKASWLQDGLGQASHTQGLQESIFKKGGEKICCASAVGRGESEFVRTSSAHSKVCEERGEGEFQVWGWVSSGCRSSLLQPMEHPNPKADEFPKEAMILWRAHPAEGSWQNLWICGKREDPSLEQVCWQDSWPCSGLCSQSPVPRGRDTLEQCVRRTHTGVCAGLSPVAGTTHWRRAAGEECEESWRGWSSRDSVWWTDTASLPIPLCYRRAEVEKAGMKLSPRRREEWGKVFYALVLLVTIYLNGNKLISLNLFCPWQ